MTIQKTDNVNWVINAIEIYRLVNATDIMYVESIIYFRAYPPVSGEIITKTSILAIFSQSM